MWAMIAKLRMDSWSRRVIREGDKSVRETPTLFPPVKTLAATDTV